MAEPVRLVVWDLDETFWRGTLTEGGIGWRDDCQAIVAELSRRGIVNSICSKNDFETVKAILVERDVWDYFIFPSIDWSPKGPRIRQLIETVQLRSQTVVLIDDNHLNLEEAKFFAPGIQVAADTIIPSILSDPLFIGKNDRAMTRLNQYKVLERRKADEEHERDVAGGDNASFLKASDIRVRIENDVEAHLDRAIELINRTNQLNFIKRRLPEDLDLARERLRHKLSDFATQAGLVEVSDKYGDYGFCGYFQVSTRREVARLQQFCFSCRILDMGVEAWVYQRLGEPKLEVHGEVLSDPASQPPVDWIRLGTESADPTAVGSAPGLGSVAARGGCILWPLAHYFRLSSERVISEFNTVRDGKLIMLDHSVCLRNAIEGVTREQIQAVAPLGYVAEDFQTEYFNYSGDKPLWILSNWADLLRRVYRHKRTGIIIPYHPPRTDADRATFESLKDYLENEFTRHIIREAEFKEILSLIFSKLPSHGLMFLLLITEAARRPGGEQVPHPQRRTFNRWCSEAAAPYSNVHLVRVADFVRDDSEILNQKNTHFDRRVYHRLYLHMLEEARTDIARSTSEPMLQARTGLPNASYEAARGDRPSRIQGQEPILKRRLILHLGLSKTGTTSIQSFLRGNPDILAASGVSYPDLVGERSTHPALAPSILRPAASLELNHAALALEIRRDVRDSRDRKISTPLWSALFERIETGSDHTVIISYENFYNRPDLYVFDSLAANLKAFDIQGIIYLRPQEDWFASLYSQSVKGAPRTTASFAEFASQRKSNLTYSTMLDNVSTYLPIDQLIVEDFNKASSSGLLNDFIEKVGMSRDLAISARNQAAVNRSLPYWATLFLLKCNQVRIPDEAFLVVRRMLASMKPGDVAPLRPGLDVATPGEREALRNIAAADADRLMGRYGVTLGQRTREPVPYRPFDDEDVETIRKALAGKIPPSVLETLDGI